MFEFFKRKKLAPTKRVDAGSGLWQAGSFSQWSSNNWRALLGGTLVAATLLSCAKVSAPPATPTVATHYEAHCIEHLPVSTLGERSQPTKAQEAALCACIWSELGTWEKRTSEQILAHENVSEFYSRAFMSRFGAAVEKCGGMKL
jgi:hypothetical protein